jgi:hypothetical protein
MENWNQQERREAAGSSRPSATLRVNRTPNEDAGLPDGSRGRRQVAPKKDGHSGAVPLQRQALSRLYICEASRRMPE